MNYPDLANYHVWYGDLFIDMGENSEALSYSERALDILQYSVPLDHLDIKSLNECIKGLEKML